ncbi:TrbG/VirB9 family P-type conjugative transfer protein [Acetobacter sp.]|uniref:TrbG/VirB9 family P-type conjugative transfer protein n=1 Tax=Acetobacter sp. TaxID=440 RepID=UPI0025BEFA06|nr:TrbG/VirB9 family P-type conjugative transfer protein [Acetobacter sp.]MCI1301332.1 TrbG/VirB9 family P-type conjugative transfer protein [Acetobacter sp.]
MPARRHNGVRDNGLMKKTHLLVALGILSGCAHDHDADTAPVRVNTPGMPSAELALQQSIDRVHAFITNMQQRLGDDPALRIRPGLTRPVAAVVPQAQATATSPVTPGTAPATPAPSSPAAHSATPLVGKGGVTWFAFGDGTPTITCHHPAICLLRLEPGETAQAGQITLSDTANWHTDLVRGTRGIHAGWALAIEPGPQAQQAQLSLPTSRRVYNIQLAAALPSMTVVAFTHAPGDPLSQPEITPRSGITGTPDFAYRMTGNAPWKPMRVYREAGQTYIQFPPGGINAAPRLLVISPKAANAQDYTVVGDSYVIPRAVDEALLIGNGAQAPEIHITHGGTE